MVNMITLCCVIHQAIKISYLGLLCSFILFSNSQPKVANYEVDYNRSDLT